MGYYADLREYISELEARGLVRRVSSRICKDTELMPLVRLQFRGLPAEQRTAFVFDDVTDVAGRRYRGSLAVGVLGASRGVYAAALGCRPEEIRERWAAVHRGYVEPRMVTDGPVKEEIHVGEGLLEHDGLLEFPHPISTPGFDPAPFLTSPYWITKDPETGVRNVGTYRGMIKGPGRTGVMVHQSQHIGLHFQKAKARGQNLEAAVVVGCVPAVGLCSVAKIPFGIDEYTVAGGIAGGPLDLVKCETVDLEVPAAAEIVIEGYIDTSYREAEAPFGEYTGYMGTRAMNPVFTVTAITHRKEPMYQAFLSQFPPSESSLIRKLAYDGVYLNFLKNDCNIPGVLDVQLHESTGSYGLMVIQLRKSHHAQPWQALNAAVALDPTIGKTIVAVDEDIDPADADAVNWAMAYRMRPHLDVRITTGKMSILDPSSAPPDAPVDEQRFPPPVGTSAMLIDATIKWDYPPTSLPRRPFMEKAIERWKAEGLPELSLRNPWHGYELGYWTDEARREAEAATEGRYLETGDRLLSSREDLPRERGGEG
ncbi:MAG: UbiD family decarboxylase [Actinobacteria bacterium]|nr:UbiD family decarboxylase [Actinomycetota bacterium]